MKKWVKNDRDWRCPTCSKITEILQDEKYEYAERCPRCRWIQSFPATADEVFDEVFS